MDGWIDRWMDGALVVYMIKSEAIVCYNRVLILLLVPEPNGVTGQTSTQTRLVLGAQIHSVPTTHSAE